MHFLWACGESANLELVKNLTDLEFFREFFKEEVSESQDRWDAVLNGMDEFRVRAITMELQLFRHELEYTLAATNVDDPDALELLRRIAQMLYRSEAWSDSYDDVKSMSQFFWAVYTGWDWVGGYTGKDHIAEVIEAI